MFLGVKIYVAHTISCIGISRHVTEGYALMRLRTKLAWICCGFDICGVMFLTLMHSPLVVCSFVFGFLTWIIAEGNTRLDEERIKHE